MPWPLIVALVVVPIVVFEWWARKRISDHAAATAAAAAATPPLPPPPPLATNHITDRYLTARRKVVARRGSSNLLGLLLTLAFFAGVAAAIWQLWDPVTDRVSDTYNRFVNEDEWKCDNPDELDPEEAVECVRKEHEDAVNDEEVKRILENPEAYLTPEAEVSEPAPSAPPAETPAAQSSTTSGFWVEIVPDAEAAAEAAATAAP